MIMLHILLIILKILGILLLVILGIVLFLLLAILFLPVRYQAEGQKDAKSLRGSAGLSWLCHLISFKVRYEEGKNDYSVRICGIPVLKIQDYFQNRKNTRQKQSVKPEKPRESVRSKESERTEPHPVKPDSKELPPVKPEPEKEKKKDRDFFAHFRLTVQKICDKIEKIKLILKSERFKNAKIFAFRELKKLLCHLKPTKLQGTLKFGTADPCTTGELLAAAGIFYPLYGEHFTIEPHFEDKMIEGNVWIRGRIRGIVLALIAWKAFRNRDIRYLIKKFKQL